MRVYVVATDRNYALAKSLLRNLPDVTYTRDFGDKAANADLGQDEWILAVIDSGLLSDATLGELIGQFAGQYPDKLIPVIFDSVEHPDFINSAISYNPKSPDSLAHVRRAVESRITSAPHPASKRDYQGILTAFRIVSALGLVSAGVGLGTLIASGVTTVSRLFLLITVICVFVTLLLGTKYRSRRGAHRVREQHLGQRNYIDRLEDLTLFDNANTGTFRSVMGLGYFASQNANIIRGYYERVRRLAQIAFALAGIMCVVGFGVAVGAIFLVMFNFSDNLIMVFVIAIMAIAMAIITQATLKFYKYTADQTKFYYRAQHENERLIVSVSLVERMNNEKSRDTLIAKIVNEELELNAAEMSEESKTSA